MVETGVSEYWVLNGLTLSNVSGCFGLDYDGEAVDWEATYDITTDAGRIAITE